MRQWPSVTSTRIGRLSKGDAVWVAGRVRDGRGQAWYLVDYEQSTQGQGYVYASLLQKSLGFIDTDEGKQQQQVAVQTVVSRKDAVTTGPVAGMTGPVAGMIDLATGMDLVSIPQGCFQMRSNNGGNDDEKLVLEVCVNDFWMGKYEVTQGQWQKIMGDNPASFQKGDNYPVEQVSWKDAQKFITKLNKKSGKKYRLPTEAEWEYAVRAGTKTSRHWGNDISCDKAMYGNNKDWNSSCSDYVRKRGLMPDSTAPVGSYPANQFGLYDMMGNVWEWCADWYEEKYYASCSGDNPTGPLSGSNRVIRGGSWDNSPGYVRSTYRHRNTPDDRNYYMGFRLARSLSSVEQSGGTARLFASRRPNIFLCPNRALLNQLRVTP